MWNKLTLDPLNISLIATLNAVSNLIEINSVQTLRASDLWKENVALSRVINLDSAAALCDLEPDKMSYNRHDV